MGEDTLPPMQLAVCGRKLRDCPQSQMIQKCHFEESHSYFVDVGLE